MNRQLFNQGIFSNYNSLRRRQDILLVAMLALCACLVGLCGCSSVLGTSEQSWTEALKADSVLNNGFARNDFVEETPYEILDVTCSDITKLNDNEASANLTATIENASFTSNVTLSGFYNKQTQQYGFQPTDIKTTPKKGVDFILDDTGNKTAVESDFDGQSKSTCTVEVESQAWFIENPIRYTYSFSFDELSGAWIQDDEPTPEFTFANIDGDYYAKTGDLTNCSKFTISNFDVTTGAFNIEYATTVVAYSNAGGTVKKEIDVSGTLSGYVDPDQSSDFLTSGRMYIEAKGNSDSGEGQASLQGYLVTSTAGEKSIEVQNFAFDAAATSSFFIPDDNQPLDSSRTRYWNGNLYKQEG